MTIQDWGAIGEIIGAIAVVASLIYLAIQIRQNTRQIADSADATRLAAFERNVEASIRIRELLSRDEALAELFLAGREDYEALSRVDRFRFDQLLRLLFSSMQVSYVRRIAVDGNARDIDGLRMQIDALVRAPGVRDWLNRSDTDWRADFAALVDDCLAANGRSAASRS